VEQKPLAKKRRPATPPREAASTPITVESLTTPAPCLLTTTDDTPQLTRSQQTEYLRLLTLGASPAAACQKVGVSITAVLVTMDQSAGFRKRMDRVPDLLSQNVAASLYQAAMKGSVTAQTFYLKNLPPPEWDVEGDEPVTPEAKDFENLTLDQLRQLDADESDQFEEFP